MIRSEVPPRPARAAPARAGSWRAACESWPGSLALALSFTLAYAAKRPSQLLVPQLFAEDGTVFVTDALTRGWRDLFNTRVGYLELFPRIGSHLVVSVDMR